jgi:hypothetical protein
VKIPFVGSSYLMDARSFDVQRSINLYPLVSEVANSKSITALRGTAGLSLFATAGGGAIRGAFSSTSGRGYVVSSDGFYEVFANGTTTLRGSLNTQTKRVSMAENNDQIIVVDGTDGWIWTQSTDTWAQITDVNFPTCSIVSYQDGYFITFEDGTQKFYISAINDGTSWGALDFTSVESSPDNLTGILSDNGNVWLFGNRSVEVYQNTGNADFPFERIAGAIIQVGCASGFTVSKFDNSVAWLGQDEQGQGVVWRAEGYQAKRISTQAIESRIASAGDFTDSYAWVYHEQGHIFYCLQIKGLDTTLVYDGSTGQWHERMFKDPVTNTRTLHRGSCVMFFANKVLVGDRENGNIYHMSLAYQDDNGDEQIRERTSPHLQDEKRLVPHSCFELDMEVGIGLNSGQGSDPQIMLQYSDDGGYTWSSELWKTIGRMGNYRTRVDWRQLGLARDRVYRVRVSDPIFVQFNEAFLNAT